MKKGTKMALRMATGSLVAVLSLGCMMHMATPDVQPPAASEFGTGPRSSSSGAYTASILPEGELKVRKLQTVRVAVADSAGTPVEGATIAIDGGMPQHGHGLPTTPRVTRSLGNGEYLVEGLRFNMGGWWVLRFDVDGSAGRDTITFNLEL